MGTRTILVLAAHPDDEVLGCGGTIARLAREGDSVFIGILGEGVTSRFATRDASVSQAVESLHGNARQAGQMLGAKDLFTFQLPDNRFDTVPLLDIAKMIEGLIERLSPQVIYTQHGGDLNIDHSILFRATLTATRPVPGSSIETVFAYEVGSSTDWAFQNFTPAFRPNVFVDVSHTLEVKLRAMRTYESETRPYPHPRSAEALQAKARYWGSISGFEAAEAFELVRHLSGNVASGG